MKYFFTLLLICLFLSCDKKQETSKKQESKPLLSIVNEFSSTKKVKAIYNNEIQDWEELKAVESFLDRFKKVSPKEVLSNALELQGLVKSLKDSVTPSLFDNSSFKARVNIFYNEVLRLSDMTSIPSIKADEVNLQTEKIINAFSAVNSKVNSILSKKRFEDEIDVDLKYIGLDSTRIDSVSKKAIKKELLQRNDNNRKLDYKEKQRQ